MWRGLRFIWFCVAFLATVSLRADTPDPTASAPASAPAWPLAHPAKARVRLLVAGHAEPCSYWLRLPAGYEPGQKPAMVVCLHGTDDTAEQAIDFWSALRTTVPVILAAPQGRDRGWSDVDLPTIRAMIGDINARFGYDAQRVLLAGFSAGGAMTFELLYKERFPATAAAALANYVPPRISQADAAARRQVPVFYAVGMADINHERMRVGLDFLRTAGANIDIYRPRIGHTLDAGVGQAAMDWFCRQARRGVESLLEEAANSSPALAVEMLEAVTAQARWHEPAQVTQARERLDRAEAAGRADFNKAIELEQAGQGADAAELLISLEARYGHGRLALEARSRREILEKDPAVVAELRRRQALARADEAQVLYAAAQRAVAQNRLTEAAEQCRRILDQYPDTPAAGRARQLQGLLQARSRP